MAGGLEHREVVGLDIDAATDVVWDHLREPALVRRWFGWDREGIDGEIREMFGVRPVASETSSVGGAPVRALAWPRGDRVQLTPVAGESHHRSRLSVQRTAHDGITTFDGVHDPRDEAWIAGAHQLKFALEQFPGEERRTVVMRDVDAGPLRDRLLDRLGLHGLRGVPVGGHVEAALPDGSMIGGQILYKSQHQVGLRLYAERPALLVLMETPAVSRPPHGLLTAVLSLYGVDDEAVARVLGRWETWWSGAATSSTASPRRTRVS